MTRSLSSGILLIAVLPAIAFAAPDTRGEHGRARAAAPPLVLSTESAGIDRPYRIAAGYQARADRLPVRFDRDLGGSGAVGSVGYHEGARNPFRGGAAIDPSLDARFAQPPKSVGASIALGF